MRVYARRSQVREIDPHQIIRNQCGFKSPSMRSATHIGTKSLQDGCSTSIVNHNGNSGRRSNREAPHTNRRVDLPTSPAQKTDVQTCFLLFRLHRSQLRTHETRASAIVEHRTTHAIKGDTQTVQIHSFTMPPLGWTPTKARFLCLAFLEVNKKPLKRGERPWPLILKMFNQSIDQYNQELDGKLASGGDSNNDEAASNVRVSPHSNQYSLGAFFNRIRRPVLQLREHRPSTPHMSEEAEVRWIADWYQSHKTEGENCSLSVEILATCWKVLKDAPQLAERSSQATISPESSPRPSPRPSLTSAKTDMEFPTSAPGCHDDQCSDDSDQESEDETEDESGNGSDDEKEQDGGSTPILPNDDGNKSVCESDGNNGRDENDGAIDRDRGDDEKEQKHLGFRHTRIRIRSKKRKRRTQSTSNETGSAHSHSATNDDDITDDTVVADEVTSFNDISAGGTRRAPSLPDHRPSPHSRGSNSINSTNTNPQHDRSSSQHKRKTKKIKALEHKLRVAKLERICQDIRVRQLDLKMQLAKAKQRLEEARGHPHM